MNKFYAKNIFSLPERYIEKLRNWRNQEFVREKMFNNEVINKEEHINYIKKIRSTQDTSMYIFFYDGNPIGVVYFFWRSKEKRIVEFGYYLIRDNYINKGFGAIMEYMLLEFLFDKKRIHKILARTLSCNKQVIELHKKFRFNVIGKGIKNNKKFVIQELDSKYWMEIKEDVEKIISTKNLGRFEE